MPLDPLSALGGAVLWEVGKQVFGAALKRRVDSADAKRKMIRDDLSLATAQISACIDAAVNYFTGNSPDVERRERSAAVRRTLRELASKLHQINLGLETIGAGALDPQLMIRFRQAATMHLDEADPRSLLEDDPLLSSVFRAGHHLQAALTRRRFEAT